MYNGAAAGPPCATKEERLRAFKLAMGQAAYELEVKLHGGKVGKKRRRTQPQDGTGASRKRPKR